MRITRRHLQVRLGALWLLDGLLQCQPFMFSGGFTRMFLNPSLSDQPALLVGPLHLVAAMVSAHPVLANAAFASIQIFLGVALLTRRHTRVVLSVSVAWALSVWVAGEGWGGLTTGSTLLSGAPGAALLYALIAILAWPTVRYQGEESPSWLAFPAWAMLWLAGAALQLVAGNNSAMAFTMMLRSAQVGSPRWIVDIDRRLLMLRAPTWSAAGVAGIFILVALWILVPGWTRKLSISIGLAISLASWLVFQGLGDLTSGRATDPNSGPLIVLLAVAVIGANQASHHARSAGNLVELEQFEGAIATPPPATSQDEFSLM